MIFTVLLITHEGKWEDAKKKWENYINKLRWCPNKVVKPIGEWIWYHPLGCLGSQKLTNLRKFNFPWWIDEPKNSGQVPVREKGLNSFPLTNFVVFSSKQIYNHWFDVPCCWFRMNTLIFQVPYLFGTLSAPRQANMSGKHRAIRNTEPPNTDGAPAVPAVNLV